MSPKEASKHIVWTSLTVQWSGLDTFTARGVGSNPGEENKTPKGAWHG